MAYFPVTDWSVFGIDTPGDFDAPAYRAKDWTRANILENLVRDVDFGFEKALGKRGISASLMHTCVKQWMWILEDPLHDQADELYTQYGLPFFKAVALKYGLQNEIGDDAGDEDKYSEDRSLC